MFNLFFRPFPLRYAPRPRVEWVLINRSVTSAETSYREIYTKIPTKLRQISIEIEQFRQTTCEMFFAAN